MKTNKTDQDHLDDLRHSAAHLLAAAVMDLWPDTKRAIGPAIDNGFYFDFEFMQPISESDFPKIEKKMRQILKSWDSFENHLLSAQEAKKEYPNNPYKHQLIDEFSEGGKKKISFYKSGNYWDLCRGGHVQNPKETLQYFKLQSIAGAYWRGDEKNKMLTRIYGTAFPTKDQLEHHLNMQEEAKKRDHKKIAKDQELFLNSPDIGGGLPVFLPKGTIIRNEIENYLTQSKMSKGYQFVWTPHIAKSDLYIKSGHWKRYDAMYQPMNIDGEEYVLKPMNCPHHFQIYTSRPRSYKELPLRLAENGTCYRHEKSGQVNGLFRVRALTIDDTHTFVSHDQIESEIVNVLQLVKELYQTFGFNDYQARISTHDPDNWDKYQGTKENWNQAETSLQKVIKDAKIDYHIEAGEAAFYGPKIDFITKDSLGRLWQLSTIQLDFTQPENFDLSYTDENGQKKRPAVLHIGAIGSVERLMGILIEHYAGAFPTWLAPIQAVIIPISQDQLDFANNIAQTLTKSNIRHQILEEGSMQKRIRHSEQQKIPYMLIIGQKEIESKTISLRGRGQKDLGNYTLERFVGLVSEEISKKT